MAAFCWCFKMQVSLSCLRYKTGTSDNSSDCLPCHSRAKSVGPPRISCECFSTSELYLPANTCRKSEGACFVPIFVACFCNADMPTIPDGPKNCLPKYKLNARCPTKFPRPCKLYRAGSSELTHFSQFGMETSPLTSHAILFCSRFV
jgi:hypothetical protein